MPLARRRIPIPGWRDDEVDRWLRTNRGSIRQALAALFPDLQGDDRSRARDRIKYMRNKMKSEGLDFSVSKAPPPPENVVRFERPNSKRTEATPPPAQRVRPPLPPDESIAARSRIGVLEWTINEAAAKARDMPADKSAASYLKIITEAHAELDQLRKSDVGDDVDLTQVLDFVARIAGDLPNAFVDAMVAEYLRRNPKHHVGLKAKAG
jgi:hypothetical protein